MERIYFIDGLDCANCAAKLERHLCEVPYFDQVVIDFMAKKMIVTVKDEASLQNGMVLADILIKQMEPGVVVSEKEIAGKKRRPPAEAHHHEETCGCGHSHHACDETEERAIVQEKQNNGRFTGEMKQTLIKIGISAVLFLAALFTTNST